MTEPPHQRATRVAYDEVAQDYADLLRDELASKPFDRAILGAFAEVVGADGGGLVADVGCGPGRITAHLHDLGVDAFGIDLSPAMVAVATAAHPSLRFEVGSMQALALDDGSVDGVVAWYSIIHTPPAELPALFSELHRVLRPGGHLLVAFQVGDGCVHLDHAYGHDLSLDAYRLAPDAIAALLDQAGLSVTARLLRGPGDRERQDQAFLMARKGWFGVRTGF